MVVLGCGIDAEGNLNPDAELSVRLAIKALGEHDNACMIMTGNISYKASFKPSISEAQAMKDYAMSLGVSGEKIFVETESKDSLGNLVFTKMNLLTSLNIHYLTIVRGPNQSDERIDYLAAKILGPDYHYVLMGSDIARPNEAEREKRSLSLAKKWLDPIQDGDTASIYRLMRDKHPGYNSAINISSPKELL